MDDKKPKPDRIREYYVDQIQVCKDKLKILEGALAAFDADGFIGIMEYAVSVKPELTIEDQIAVREKIDSVYERDIKGGENVNNNTG